MTDIIPGSLLRGATGTYRVVKPLGLAGALGEVHLVVNGENDKYALKLAKSDLTPEMIRRFEDEIGVLQRLRRQEEIAGTRHIPRVVECSTLKEPETQVLYRELGNRPFILMTFAEGTPLDVLLEEGVLNENEALDIATQFAEVLHAVHKERLTYRDMKIGNLFWDRKHAYLTVIDWNVVGDNLQRDGYCDRLKAAAYLYQMVTGDTLPITEDPQDGWRLENNLFRRSTDFKRLTEGTRHLLILYLQPPVAHRRASAPEQPELTRYFLNQLATQKERFDLPAQELFNRAKKEKNAHRLEQALFYVDALLRFHNLSPKRKESLENTFQELQRKVEGQRRHNFESGKSRFQKGLFAEALRNFEVAMEEDPFDDEARAYAIAANVARNHEATARGQVDHLMAIIRWVMEGNWILAEQAVEELTQAFDVEPLQSEIDIRRALENGSQHLLNGQMEQATQSFKQAHANLAKVLYPQILENCIGNIDGFQQKVYQLVKDREEAARLMQRGDYRWAAALYGPLRRQLPNDSDVALKYRKAQDLMHIQQLAMQTDYAEAWVKLIGLPENYFPDPKLEDDKAKVRAKLRQLLWQRANAAQADGDQSMERRLLYQISEFFSVDDRVGERLRQLDQQKKEYEAQQINVLEEELLTLSSLSGCGRFVQKLSRTEINDGANRLRLQQAVENRERKIRDLERRYTQAETLRNKQEILEEAIERGYLVSDEDPATLKVKLEAEEKRAKEECKKRNRDLDRAPSEQACQDIIDQMSKYPYSDLDEGKQLLEKAATVASKIKKLQTELEHYETEKCYNAKIKLLQDHKNYQLKDGSAEELFTKELKRLTRLKQDLKLRSGEFFRHEKSLQKFQNELGYIEQNNLRDFEEGEDYYRRLQDEEKKLAHWSREYQQHLNAAEPDYDHLLEVISKGIAEKYCLSSGDKTVSAAKLASAYNQRKEQYTERLADLEKQFESDVTRDKCTKIIEELDKENISTAKGWTFKKNVATVREDIGELESALAKAAKWDQIVKLLKDLERAEAKDWRPNGREIKDIRPGYELALLMRSYEILDVNFSNDNSATVGEWHKNIDEAVLFKHSQYREIHRKLQNLVGHLLHHEKPSQVLTLSVQPQSAKKEYAALVSLCLDWHRLRLGLHDLKQTIASTQTPPVKTLLTPQFETAYSHWSEAVSEVKASIKQQHLKSIVDLTPMLEKLWDIINLFNYQNHERLARWCPFVEELHIILEKVSERRSDNTPANWEHILSTASSLLEADDEHPLLFEKFECKRRYTELVSLHDDLSQLTISPIALWLEAMVGDYLEAIEPWQMLSQAPGDAAYMVESLDPDQVVAWQELVQNFGNFQNEMEARGHDQDSNLQAQIKLGAAYFHHITDSPLWSATDKGYDFCVWFNDQKPAWSKRFRDYIDQLVESMTRTLETYENERDRISDAVRTQLNQSLERLESLDPHQYEQLQESHGHSIISFNKDYESSLTEANSRICVFDLQRRIKDLCDQDGKDYSQWEHYIAQVNTNEKIKKLFKAIDKNAVEEIKEIDADSPNKKHKKLISLRKKFGEAPSILMEIKKTLNHLNFSEGSIEFKKIEEELPASKDKLPTIKARMNVIDAHLLSEPDQTLLSTMKKNIDRYLLVTNPISINEFNQYFSTGNAGKLKTWQDATLEIKRQGSLKQHMIPTPKPNFVKAVEEQVNSFIDPHNLKRIYELIHWCKENDLTILEEHEPGNKKPRSLKKLIWRKDTSNLIVSLSDMDRNIFDKQLKKLFHQDEKLRSPILLSSVVAHALIALVLFAGFQFLYFYFEKESQPKAVNNGEIQKLTSLSQSLEEQICDLYFVEENMSHELDSYRNFFLLNNVSFLPSSNYRLLKFYNNFYFIKLRSKYYQIDESTYNLFTRSPEEVSFSHTKNYPIRMKNVSQIFIDSGVKILPNVPFLISDLDIFNNNTTSYVMAQFQPISETSGNENKWVAIVELNSANSKPLIKVSQNDK